MSQLLENQALMAIYHPNYARFDGVHVFRFRKRTARRVVSLSGVLVLMRHLRTTRKVVFATMLLLIAAWSLPTGINQVEAKIEPKGASPPANVCPNVHRGFIGGVPPVWHPVRHGEEQDEESINHLFLAYHHVKEVWSDFQAVVSDAAFATRVAADLAANKIAGLGGTTADVVDVATSRALQFLAETTPVVRRAYNNLSNATAEVAHDVIGMADGQVGRVVETTSLAASYLADVVEDTRHFLARVTDSTKSHELTDHELALKLIGPIPICSIRGAPWFLVYSVLYSLLFYALGRCTSYVVCRFIVKLANLFTLEFYFIMIYSHVGMYDWNSYEECLTHAFPTVDCSRRVLARVAFNCVCISYVVIAIMFAVSIVDVVVYSWHLSRRANNRLAHALNGNISFKDGFTFTTLRLSTIRLFNLMAEYDALGNRSGYDYDTQTEGIEPKVFAALEVSYPHELASLELQFPGEIELCWVVLHLYSKAARPQDRPMKDPQWRQYIRVVREQVLLAEDEDEDDLPSVHAEEVGGALPSPIDETLAMVEKKTLPVARHIADLELRELPVSARVRLDNFHNQICTLGDMRVYQYWRAGDLICGLPYYTTVSLSVQVVTALATWWRMQDRVYNYDAHKHACDLYLEKILAPTNATPYEKHTHSVHVRELSYYIAKSHWRFTRNPRQMTIAAAGVVLLVLIWASCAATFVHGHTAKLTSSFQIDLSDVILSFDWFHPYVLIALASMVVVISAAVETNDWSWFGVILEEAANHGLGHLFALTYVGRFIVGGALGLLEACYRFKHLSGNDFFLHCTSISACRAIFACLNSFGASLGAHAVANWFSPIRFNLWDEYPTRRTHTAKITVPSSFKKDSSLSMPKEELSKPVDRTRACIYDVGCTVDGYEPVAYAPNASNELNAVMNRVVVGTPEVDVHYMRGFIRFVKNNVHVFFPGIAGTRIEPYSFTSWIESSNASAAAKRRITQAYASFVASGHSIYQRVSKRLAKKWTKRKGFVKVENNLYRSPAGISSKAPRLIQAATDEYLFVVGPWVAAFQSRLKEVWNPGFPICFTSGVAAHRCANMIMRHSGQIFEDDVSSYDSSISFELAQLELWLFTYFGAPKLAAQLKHENIYTNGITFSGIQYRVPGTRKSGDPDTSLMNSILNALLHLYVIRTEYNLSIRRLMRITRMLVQGDDNLSSLCVSNRLDLAPAMLRLGFKCEALWRDHWHDAEFCSCRIVPTSHGYTFVPKPMRLLMKFGQIINPPLNVAPLSVLRGIALGLEGFACYSRILGTLVERVLYLTEGHDVFNSKIEDWKMVSRGGGQPIPETHAAELETYGISENTMSRVLECIGSMGISEKLPRELFAPLCDRDSAAPLYFLPSIKRAKPVERPPAANRLVVQYWLRRLGLSVWLTLIIIVALSATRAARAHCLTVLTHSNLAVDVDDLSRPFMVSEEAVSVIVESNSLAIANYTWNPALASDIRAVGHLDDVAAKCGRCDTPPTKMSERSKTIKQISKKVEKKLNGKQKKTAEKAVVEVIKGKGAYRPSSMNRAKLDKIRGKGGYISDFLGKVGTSVGGWLGDKFESLTGWGDYRDRAAKHKLRYQRSPPSGRAATLMDMVSNPDALSMGQASARFAGGPPIIVHREFVGNVYSSEDFSTTSYRIQPGLSGANVLFPWLSRAAQCFEQYRLEGMILEYESTSSEFTTSSSLGSVYMSTVYDADAPPLGSEVAVANNEYTTFDKISNSFLHPIECAREDSPITLRYVNDNNTTSTDPAWSDVGKFQVSVTGCQDIGSIIGKLWCIYKIRFYKPVLPDIHIGTTYVAGTVTQQLTLTNVFEQLTENPSNSLPVKLYDSGGNNTTVVMPNGYSGAYQLTLTGYNSAQGTSSEILAPNMPTVDVTAMGTDIVPLLLSSTTNPFNLSTGGSTAGGASSNVNSCSDTSISYVSEQFTTIPSFNSQALTRLSFFFVSLGEHDDELDFLIQFRQPNTQVTPDVFSGGAPYYIRADTHTGVPNYSLQSYGSAVGPAYWTLVITAVDSDIISKFNPMAMSSKSLQKLVASQATNLFALSQQLVDVQTRLGIEPNVIMPKTDKPQPPANHPPRRNKVLGKLAEVAAAELIRRDNEAKSAEQFVVEPSAQAEDAVVVSEVSTPDLTKSQTLSAISTLAKVVGKLQL